MDEISGSVFSWFQWHLGPGSLVASTKHVHQGKDAEEWLASALAKRFGARRFWFFPRETSCFPRGFDHLKPLGPGSGSLSNEVLL